MLSDRSAPLGEPPGGRVGAPLPARGRVLIVEDDPALREAYAEVLLDEGFDVACVGDEPDALRALAQESFDVVLSDVLMPGGSGVDVLRAVRERRLGVPVVLVTGSPSVETAVQALEMGALHYLLKPVSRDALVNNVDHAAHLRRLSSAMPDALRDGATLRPLGDRAEQEAAFDRALASLHMAYQPIIRTRDGSVFAWEALLRTREPSIGGPLAFLETAEKLGRVGELSRAIHVSVARTAKHARGTVFFVNLHPDDLLDDDLYDPAGPLAGLAADVVLEVAERSPIEGIPDIRARAVRLRELGFRLAIDDLGSGHAGLTSLAALQPDFVKLDRKLVAGIDREPLRAKLVGSVVSVSRDLGIGVIAEGVERSGERETVAGLGCDLMQGFLFRRPEEIRSCERFFLAGPEPPAGE